MEGFEIELDKEKEEIPRNHPKHKIQPRGTGSWRRRNGIPFSQRSNRNCEKDIGKRDHFISFTVKKKEKDGSLRPILDLKSLKQKSDDDKETLQKSVHYQK